MLAVMGLLVVCNAGLLQMKGPGQASFFNHFTWQAHSMPLIQAEVRTSQVTEKIATSVVVSTRRKIESSFSVVGLGSVMVCALPWR
jgi:hypothetical protein